MGNRTVKGSVTIYSYDDKVYTPVFRNHSHRQIWH